MTESNKENTIEFFDLGETTKFKQLSKEKIEEIEENSYSINPIIFDIFEKLMIQCLKGYDFSDDEITIPTVNPERTFLEKIFLLHEEFQLPVDRMKISRKSRHLYDLERLMDTDFADLALRNKELYDSIVEHRRTLTRIRGIDYANHSPQKINIIPPDEMIGKWEKDYVEMQQSMLYNPSLPFDELIQRIKELKSRINNLNI